MYMYFEWKHVHKRRMSLNKSMYTILVLHRYVKFTDIPISILKEDCDRYS